MITVVGYDGAALSALAGRRLADATLVVGGERHLAAVAVPPLARTLVMGSLPAALAAIGSARLAGEKVVVLASGDPGFFGLVRRLQETGMALEVLPAVSSVAAAFARLGLGWEDAVVVSAHGRPLAPALAALRRFPKVALFTDAASAPPVLVAALGADCPELIVFERLGEADERSTAITTRTGPGTVHPDQVAGRAWQQPLLVVRADAQEAGPRPWLSGAVAPSGWALADDQFAHRDEMITKREVRALVLARLAPAVGQLLWDVGAGSGSVAVECSRLGAAVVAVERDAADCARIRANAVTHAAPLQVVHGAAPAALDDLPRPDAVFVGGGGPTVVTAVAAARPQRLVVALVTLERVASTLAALADYQTDTVLLQAHRLQPLGTGNRLVPGNPVFVVSGVLR